MYVEDGEFSAYVFASVSGKWIHVVCNYIGPDDGEGNYNLH